MKASSSRHLKPGFTLVELLVVIAIIGILIGMLLPAVQQVREAARRSQCQNQMRQMTLGMLNYESAYQRLPPGVKPEEYTASTASDALGRPGFNWGAILLPFLEQQGAHDLLGSVSNQFREPAWIDTTATPVVNYATTILPIFICPSCPMEPINPTRNRFDRPANDEPHAKSNYIGVAGPDASDNLHQIQNLNQVSLIEEGNVATDLERLEGEFYPGVLYANSKVELSEITDGTSNTFAIGERDGAPMGSQGTTERIRDAGTWCASNRVTWQDICVGGCSSEANFFLNSTDLGFKEQFVPFSSQHPGGANFGRVDGSVVFIPDEIDGETYEFFSTKSDGDIGSL